MYLKFVILKHLCLTKICEIATKPQSNMVENLALLFFSFFQSFQYFFTKTSHFGRPGFGQRTASPGSERSSGPAVENIGRDETLIQGDGRGFNMRGRCR